MKIVIGSDEVGYGAIAGSLYVVAVAMPETWSFPGLRDSKKMSPRSREEMFDPLTLSVRGRWALATKSPADIDRVGIWSCLIEAHTDALQNLLQRFPNAEVIVDGNLVLPGVPQAKSIPKADDKFQVVSAASVIAKVLRDEAMTLLATRYPGYGFQEHKGYGTELHLTCLETLGPTPLHRRSFVIKSAGKQHKLVRPYGC